jgi:predicted enzyme related to lactoylglutathione lyase
MVTHEHGTLAHFAINADDDVATRAFYTALFGWRFEPWGPPSFFHILREDGTVPGPIGALQARRSLQDAVRMTGFECTVAVDDVDAAVAATVAHGGEVLMEKTTIVGVGDLAFVADPSGNVVGAMRYDDAAE